MLCFSLKNFWSFSINIICTFSCIFPVYLNLIFLSPFSCWNYKVEIIVNRQVKYNCIDVISHNDEFRINFHNFSYSLRNFFAWQITFLMTYSLQRTHSVVKAHRKLKQLNLPHHLPLCPMLYSMLQLTKLISSPDANCNQLFQLFLGFV